jgi:hypothetical protein
MKPDAVRHTQPIPADNSIPSQDRGLSELFALLGNEKLKEALAELDPVTRPAAKT